MLGVCWLANAGYSSTLPQEEASDNRVDARSVVERFYLNRLGLGLGLGLRLRLRYG